jgi:hypothetical protein
MIRTPLLLFLVGCAFLTSTISAEARPPYKRAIADHYGKFLSKKLNDCRTCHLPEAEAKALKLPGEKPHNVFGARLKVVRQELKKAGKPSSIENALDAIENEDADGDGVSNLVELLTGHFPGDKNDRPTELELAKSKALVIEYTKFKSGYPWRPFEKVVRPAVPKVKNTAWVKNPIDAFIAAEHEALGLKPRPEAPKSTLLRRVFLDLIGLPPTPKELHDFLADKSPDAYEKVVDRLLKSPQYGERWGRHWMDVWRYSDWAGFGAQIRDSQPHIWRWRDWIVESLNQDKGYDQMILEMLAADELYPTDQQRLRATGYLVRNYKLLSREKWMQDCVEHTSMAFLAVTLKCAKCHDHMYDPITQDEYYQFRAIFEPYQVRIDLLPGADAKVDGLVRAFDADLTVPTYFFIRGDDRMPDKKKKILPGVPEFLGGIPFGVKPLDLPQGAYAPDKQDFVIKQAIEASAAAVKKAKDAVAPAQKKGMVDAKIAEVDVQIAQAKHDALLAVLEAEKLEDANQKNSESWKKAAEKAAAAQRQANLIQAQRNVMAGEQTLAALKAKNDTKQLPMVEKNLAAAKKELEKLEVGLKQPVTTAYQPRQIKLYPKTSTGRRTALARWLASSENPLTARVAVNQIWLRHFGQALVSSVLEFGRNGQPPLHPALVDWLAAEFMAGGYSMKALHRLIVTSNTYRQSSTPDSANAKLDPDNKYYWRYKPHAAEAEVVRDLIFHVAGKLDLTMGGKEIPYTQGMTVPRRSIYFQHAAEKEMEFLQIFDGPNVTECYERKPAIVPQQALAMYNNDLVRTHARLLARKLHDQAKVDGKAFVVLAYEHVLCRAPTAEEIATCQAFLEKQTKVHTEKNPPPAGNWANGSAPHPDPQVRAREQLVHVLMNHHEFVTIR